MTIRTRFAPSPTGYLHIGGLRTALFSYLWARKNKGSFILRIEDTDQKRYVKGAVDLLIKSLINVGLQPDEGLVAPGKERGKFGPYIQSQRLKIYQKSAQDLIHKGLAYYCFCSSQRLEKLKREQQDRQEMPHYDGRCRALSETEIKKNLAQNRSAVIRFKIPPVEKIVVKDLLHGEITVSPRDLDDFILLKSDGYATYHLANVVDDVGMKISHVIRGEEWLPSLPKHILLYQAFGYKAPEFVHLPLLLNPDRSKLSKRQGDVSVEDFIGHGYLPSALINYVALLGWNPGTEREIFSLTELSQEFSLKKLNKASAIFDVQKLNWFNAEYIRKIIKAGGKEYADLAAYSVRFITKMPERAKDLLRLFGSRLSRLNELDILSAWLWKLPKYDRKLLIFKKSTKDKTELGLKLALDKLSSLDPKKWTQDNIFSALENIVKENNLAPGDVFWPVRLAISGQEKSPSPAEILEFLGAEESLARLQKALSLL
ncbi:MAG: glutamate--tRNA ligase [Parcubacteria group bacterium]|nr:MAG: glutamate--tRNA ligase [Parcubacteria group bacterium]